jgi:hypothetical protein
MQAIIRTQGLEFWGGDIQTMIENGEYIVKHRAILQPEYSKNGGERLRIIYHYSKEGLPLTKFGRFHKMKADEVNSILGFELLTA